MPDQILRTASREALKLAGSALHLGSKLTLDNVKQSVLFTRFAAHSTQCLLEGGVFPAFDSVVYMNEQLSRTLVESLRGEREWSTAWKETSAHLKGATRFARLVNTWGKSLFGSATFPGEEVLAEDGCFRLTLIPPKSGVPTAPVALFHAGGAIPYGDRIFRLLPDVNFFDRFRERGIPVYAMELKGDRSVANAGALDMDRLIDTLAHLSDVAFAHNGERKMILEGYCGHGTQAMAYVAARPEDADRKFSVFATFVAPVDGSKCDDLADAIRFTPEKMLDANMTLWGMFGGYVPGESTRIGIDLPLKAVFYKTPLGYFAMGWYRKDLADVPGVDALTQQQRRDLAGTYWVSPDNASRFPIPVGITRYTVELFKKGLGRNGEIPWQYQGRPLSLADVAAKTRLALVGFYGGRDQVVPDRTAHSLMTWLGDRYTHVVHPEAGHISYVLSPDQWAPGSKRPFKPNPVDLLLSKAVG